METAKPAEEVSEIDNSNEEVFSLYKYENAKKDERGVTYLLSRLFGGFLDIDRRSNNRDSGKDKKKFLRENRDEIIRDLESKIN